MNKPANDNQRSPEQHRAILAEQATIGERAYQGGAWPQGRRLHKAGKLVLVMGLIDWQVRNVMPRLSAANDNQAIDFDNTETVDAVEKGHVSAPQTNWKLPAPIELLHL
ncbi:hypothetical protein [Bradyrhizobium nanningense]|uniref:hypothetical protein n=1 Tax=Bradyrhizobium nanningense TaxID=1325118 RepID=UPI001FE0FEF4|nr:hypothetical protein [Bradyrhizobium nanningense]